MSVVWVVVVADQGCWRLTGTFTFISRSRSSTFKAQLAIAFKRSARQLREYKT